MNPLEIKLPHKVCDIFQPLSPDAYADLRADILQNGLLESIKVLGGEIVDGRARYQICLEAGIPLVFEEFEAHESLVEYVCRMNFATRKMNDEQKAMVAARLHATRRIPGESPTEESRLSQHDAAGACGVKVGKLEKATHVLDAVNLEITAEIDEGVLSVSSGEIIASETPRELKTRIVRSSRKTSRDIANELRVKKALRTNKKTGVTCLVCNPQIDATDDTLIVHLIALAARCPGYNNLLEDVIDEIENGYLADSYTNAKEQILDAVRCGYVEMRDIQRVTKIEAKTLESFIGLMLDHKILGAIQQGGKPDKARGARKVLYYEIALDGGADQYHVRGFDELDEDDVFFINMLRRDREAETVAS